MPPDEWTRIPILDPKKKGQGKNASDSKTSLTRSLSTLLHVAVGVFATAAVTVCAVFALASYHNYPGGRSMQRLLNHHIHHHVCEPGVPVTSPVSHFMGWSPDTSYSSSSRNSSSGSTGDWQLSVHIDVAPAMTGVSRYVYVQKIPICYPCSLSSICI